MKNRIKAAELKLYNANSRGNRSPDCVKRGLSLAFDIPYNEMGKLLNQKMKELRYDAWNRTPVFKRVIEDLGGGMRISVEESGVTVDDFADQHPSGIYIVLCGAKDDGSTTHLVTIRDGKIWDSWNSKRYFVESYWEIDGSDRKAIRDTDKNFMKGIAETYALPAVHNEILRYINKKGWLSSDASTNIVVVNDHQIAIRCKVNLFKDNILKKDRNYRFDVVLVIEPTWTEPEIIEFVQKIGKQRAYDRMWTVNEQEKKLKEAAEIENQIGEAGKLDDMYLTEQEERFVNSLPGWVRPLIQHIYIQNPGQYMDSYRLKIKKLPNDNVHPDDEYFTFEAETASDMKEMLYDYKHNLRVEGIDYSWWDEH